MKKLLFILSAAFLLFSISGCYYDNEADLYPKVPGSDTTNTCDTIGLTYTTDMLPIFNTYCNGCHGSQTPVLTGYSTTQAYVAANGTKLYDYVKNGTHNSVILSDCEKAKLRSWINAGAPQ